MDSCDDTPKGWVAPFGHPRINACSRLPVAFRSVPRPSSPPGAKASTECPSLARDPCPGPSPGTSPPCTETILSCPWAIVTGLDPVITRGRASAIAESLLLSTQQLTPLNPTPPLNAEAFGQTTRWERPETHQNLIHPDKDPSPDGNPRHRASNRRHLRHQRFQSRKPMPIVVASPRYTSQTNAGRLTISITARGGGDRTRTDDPLLAKQVLSQLSYTPN